MRGACWLLPSLVLLVSRCSDGNTEQLLLAAAMSRPSPALRDNAGYLPCCYDTTAPLGLLQASGRKTLASVDASPRTPFVQNEPAHRSSPQAVPPDSLANKERAASAPQE